MRLLVNGEPRDLPTATSVAELVAAEAPGLAEGRGVAVAIDEQVVPRSAWTATKLEEGQRVELLAAMQGG